MLTTAALRIPPSLLGEVWMYPLPARFRRELIDLGKRWRDQKDRAQTPYASLATALMAVTGRPVRILPRTRWSEGDVLLITTAPIDPFVLGLAIRKWERLCRGSDTNVLGPLLTGVTPLAQSITKAVDNPEPGRVVAESWVYHVLGWVIAQRLAAKPITFDGMSVPFRIDTSGTLVSWDTPIIKTHRSGGQARALMKITPHIKTLPGTNDLVCILEASITRLVDRLFDVKYAWIDHGRDNGGSALLRLPIGYRKGDDGWESVFSDYSADVVAACDLDPLPWGKDVLTEYPDRVRAWRATNAEHPIGTGVGPRAYLWLIEHAKSVLAVQPISYQTFRSAGPSAPAVRVLAEADGSRISPAGLDAAVSGTGHKRLRLVHLSATPVARARVREELRHYQREQAPALTPELGIVQEITAKTDVVLYDVAGLLSHGNTDRSLLLSQAPMLKSDPGTMVLALVETEYAGKEIPDDAKNEIRKALADLGVASQFLVTPPHQEHGVEETKPKNRMDRGKATKDQEERPPRDYPAEAALKDIMRCGGLTDGRLARAVTLKPCPLDRSAWLIGVHVRRQNAPRKGNDTGTKPRPKLVTVLVAIRAQSDPDQPWPMYLYRPGTGWCQHSEGLASFHADPIGVEMAHEQTAYTNLRALVDQSLRTLPGSGTEPIVVMVDGEATRRIWSGLADSGLGKGPLPGDGLPTADNVSVVRVGANDTEAPRPAHRAEGGRRPEDKHKPAAPGSQIYVHTGDDGTRSWMLGKASKTFSAGADGRCGNDYTRFTLPLKKAKLQGRPWHSFTGTEFVVARAGAFEQDTVAALTARLCAQPVSWDGRTRWPVPLHLARIADDTHPLRGAEHNNGGVGG